MSWSGPAPNSLHEYEWLVVMGCIWAFGFGWGTGSNDVANAFGTSIGAKTLTLRSATVIAAIFEFAGALILGRVSTNVIAGGIADINTFVREPEVYAYGMSCALFVGTFFLYAASYVGLNVSSTHSIIGGILGFSLVYGGGDGVLWITPDPASFPPYKGIVPIIVAWFFTPAITAGFAAILFFSNRLLVLRRKNAYNLAFFVLGPLVFLTVWICMFFVFTKGAAKMFAENDPSWTANKNRKSGWVSACIAGGCMVIALALIPLIKKLIERKMARLEEAANAKAAEGSDSHSDDAEAKTADVERADKSTTLDEPKDVAPAALADSQKSLARAPSRMASLGASLKKAAMHGVDVDVHACIETDPTVAAIHARAEVFDPKTEFVYQYLQVFSAICVIFAHGAGDVGYMTGPLCAIWFAYKDGYVRAKFEPPVWIIVIGASGLVVGLATYGYNVTASMGVKLAKLSPSRGFCAELSTALVLLVASQLGLPTSSSQCITGGIVGVGLVEGIRGINYKQLAMQVASWISTLFIMGLGTACVFSQGVYAPSIPQGDAIIQYESAILNMTYQNVAVVNATMFTMRNLSRNGTLPNLPYNLTNATNEFDFVDIKAQLASIQTILNTIYPWKVNAKTGNQTIRPFQVLGIYSQVTNLLNQIAQFDIGQYNSSIPTAGGPFNWTAATAICSNDALAPGTKSCPQVKLGVPIYYQTTNNQNVNFSTPFFGSEYYAN